MKQFLLSLCILNPILSITYKTIHTPTRTCAVDIVTFRDGTVKTEKTCFNK